MGFPTGWTLMPLLDENGDIDKLKAYGGSGSIPKNPSWLRLNKRWHKLAVGALGNAIVPQVALEIFEAINDYEKLLINNDDAQTEQRN